VTTVALVLAPVMCSVVLLLSGTAKVGDKTATRDAFISMDVPVALRSERVVTALPFLEIALGVLMLLTWSWPLAVVGAATTGLFAVYWVLVFRVLRRGEVVDCGCFGALGDDRVSAITLARNSMLVLLALLTTAFGASGSGLVPAVRDFSAGDWWWLALAVAVAVTSVLVVGVRGGAEEVVDTELLDYERVSIPFAMLEDESGTRTTLRQLAAQRPQLLFFLSSSCGACERIAAQLPDWTSSLGPVEISTVFTDPLKDLPATLRHDGVPAWLDIEGGATDTFAPTGRPAAVLLGADGSLAGGPVVGSAEVRAFVADIEAELLAGVPDVPEPSEAPSEPVRLVHEHAAPLGGHGHAHGSDDAHGHA
jgi:hypothetical protein